MSKLSFRARALDATKPMPILRTEDVPDLPDFAAINRAVPQMPTGMEKEEECEHHLQRAISAQQAFGKTIDHVIPTPEVYPVDDKYYDSLYPANGKIIKILSSNDYITIDLPSCENDYSNYDIDSEDEEWLKQLQPHLNLSVVKFEQCIEHLEKNGGHLQFNEVLQQLKRMVDEGSAQIVYDHWIEKKRRCNGKSFMPTVKTEKRDGTPGNNPYIAFRRRTEKMQTRKNRKNDESSYEKMLKLREDLTTILQLMRMVCQRETKKQDLLRVEHEIFEARYSLGDFNSEVYNELTMASKYAKNMNRSKKNDEPVHSRKKKTKRQQIDLPTLRNNEMSPRDWYCHSEDENSSDVIYQSSHQMSTESADDNPDGMFSFKRKKGCHYHAPLDYYTQQSGYPWDSPEDGDSGDKRFRFNFTSLSNPPNYFIGYGRRRIGRGGRLIFDRVLPRPPVDYVSDDDDDSDSEMIHYKPLPFDSSDSFGQHSIEFNAKYFEKDIPSFLNNQLKQNCFEDPSLEKQLFCYNESELANFNERTRTIKSHSRCQNFTKPIDEDIKNSILNILKSQNNESTSIGSSEELKPSLENEFKKIDSTITINSGPTGILSESDLNDGIASLLDHHPLVNSGSDSNEERKVLPHKSKINFFVANDKLIKEQRSQPSKDLIQVNNGSDHPSSSLNNSSNTFDGKDKIRTSSTRT